MHIGHKIKQLIEDKKITKRFFAKQLGYKEQSIHKIFASEDINTALLERIAHVLNVSIVYFFSESGTDHNEYVVDKPIQSKPLELQSLEKEIELLKRIITDKELIIKLQQEQLKK